ncbi:MAG: hypothetical protein ACTSRP_25700 [Candidatus Helarchaeota archaeon]
MSLKNICPFQYINDIQLDISKIEDAIARKNAIFRLKIFVKSNVNNLLS